MASKFILKNSSSYFKFNGTSYYLTNMSYNENYDKIEVTATDTSGDGKEYLTGRAERNFSIELYFNVSGSDISLDTLGDIYCSYEGKLYHGSGSLYTKNIVGGIDDAVKATYEGSFNGAVTVTPIS